MTVVFAGTTVLCLVVLAVIAIRVDTSERESRIATESAQQVSLVADQVQFGTHGLELGALDQRTALPDDEVYGVVSGGKIVLASPSQEVLPTDAGLATIVRSMTTTTTVARFVLPTSTGEVYRWAAVPVLDLGRVGAVVIVGGPTPGADEHRSLVSFLTGTVALLTVLAALVGHAVSGLAMRPALRSLERQEQFLVEASHELRTPLARLSLILDVEGRDPALTDRDTIDRAAAQVRGLGDLVTGLLARARAQDGRADLEFRPLRLDQLVEAQVREYAPERFRSSADAAPSVVTGNPELLAQAVRNLLENALRYGGGGVVDVTVGPRSFAVADHGPGIAEGLRAEVRNAGVGAGSGTGRGLAIVEWIAEVHHGTLHLTDTPGGGLTATLTLGATDERTP
ncbi:Sensor histidine kinase TmoS [Frondihabitans sp. 762G35]|nr:Sensor histidine kinase TmoS [Frondihabitans sp. 762G35]